MHDMVVRVEIGLNIKEHSTYIYIYIYLYITSSAIWPLHDTVVSFNTLPDLVIPGSDALEGFPTGHRPHSSSEALLDVVLLMKSLYRLEAGAAPLPVELLAPLSQQLRRLR